MTLDHVRRAPGCLRAPMLTLALSAVLASPLAAQDAAKAQNDLATAQTAANSQSGPRQAPARSFPVPKEDVSPQEQAVIANPYVGYWNADPKDAAEWKDFVAKAAAPVLAALPAMREKLGVTSEPVTIAGVKAFIVQPRVVPAANRDRLLLHVHGGGYVLSPGEAGTREAVLMAAYGASASSRWTTACRLTLPTPPPWTTRWRCIASSSRRPIRSAWRSSAPPRAAA